MVTRNPSSDSWDLTRLAELVTRRELERGRIEYKRQLDNGRKTLEAITALANTFGGVVLVGVDETQDGLARLVGVDPKEREQLVNMCWSQLNPPYDPEIIPVKIDEPGKYVLVVVVDPQHVRRPVMLNQGNKVLVRLEGANVAPDWYRLRDLFREEPIGVLGGLLPAVNVNGYSGTGQLARAIGVRGRLALAGPSRHALRITEVARMAVLEILRDRHAALTGSESTLTQVITGWCGDSTWGIRTWQLDGRSSTQVVNAGWQGLAPENGQCMAEARFLVSSALPRTRSGGLLVQLDALISDPAGLRLPVASSRQFLDLGTLGPLMLDILSTLWGPIGDHLSRAILDQPLGPPAELDLAVFTVQANQPSQIALNEYIDFGVAQLIPGNTPGPWVEWGPILPDMDLLDRDEQRKLVRQWLIELGVDSGYQNVEREVGRHTLFGQ